MDTLILSVFVFLSFMVQMVSLVMFPNWAHGIVTLLSMILGLIFIKSLVNDENKYQELKDKYDNLRDERW